MVAASDLTRARYAGRDFWTFFDDLKKRIQEKYGDEYNDFVESSMGVMLLDMMSFVAETLSFYLDRQAVESYLETALTRTAVERLTRQIGYKMSGAVSASVDLSVELTQTWGFGVTIPEGFQFQGPNDLIFEATQDVLYPAGDVGPKTVSVREGETRTQTFIATGTKNQVLELGGVDEGQYLTEGSVVVYVATDLWSEEEFLKFEQTNQFEVGYGAAPPVIRFGDGVAGNIPPAGAEIQVTYVVSSGKAGYVTSNSIDDVVTPLRVSGNEIDMTISHDEPSSGASDGESILKAKRSAPGFFRAQDSAVTKRDIEALGSAFSDSQFGSVAVAQAFSIRSADDDGYLNDQLRTIRDAAEDPVPAVESEISGATDDLSDITTAADDADGQADAIIVEAANADGEMNDAIDDIQACKNKQDTILVDAGDVQDRSGDADTEADDGKTAVDAIADGSPDQLTTATKDALKAYFDNIKQELSLIDTEGSNIVSFANNAKTDCDNAISDVQAAQERMGTIDSAADQVKVDRTTIVDTEVSSIEDHLSAIEAAVVDPSNTINTAADSVFSHVDSILSDECKANLVEVPILTLDSDGFYTGPSIALIRALQSYLDARKEPTVTIRVMSGESALVLVDMTVQLGVGPGVVKPKAISTANAIIDGLLKQRDFGASLYRSQVTDDLMDGVDGLEWVNVVLEYPEDTDKIDEYGNLIIDDLEVVSKGTVSVVAVDAE